MVNYTKYLKIEGLLSLQEPLTPGAHEELLFIITHQAYELWFKQYLLDLTSIQSAFAKEVLEDLELEKINRRLHRMIAIQKLLIEQVDVLETMSPLDFLEFRGALQNASGFQSGQFREIEARLGLKASQRLPYGSKSAEEHLDPADRIQFESAQNRASLMELIEKWLERMPFLITSSGPWWEYFYQQVEAQKDQEISYVTSSSHLNADQKTDLIRKLREQMMGLQSLSEDGASSPTGSSPGSSFGLSMKAKRSALLIQIYSDYPVFHVPAQILEKLTFIDELWTLWRNRHAQMAMRMLGLKMGTGGSSGSAYLEQSAKAHTIFTDLTTLATYYIPRSARPALPPDLESRFRFNGHSV